MSDSHFGFPSKLNHHFERPHGDLPVGSVVTFAGAVVNAQDSTRFPNQTNSIETWGWLLCDGRSLAAHQYPELFAVLGYVYGGSGDQFNIPDYRGSFLRGIGTGTRNAPDIDMRSVPLGGQCNNSGVGSTQSFSLETHERTYSSAPAPSATSPIGAADGAPNVTSTLTTDGFAPETGQPNAALVSQHETRPTNVNINYIIKFTNRHF